MSPDNAGVVKPHASKRIYISQEYLDKLVVVIGFDACPQFYRLIVSNRGVPEKAIHVGHPMSPHVFP